MLIPEGSHPFPFRIRKLSPPGPMVLYSQGYGRVGRRPLFYIFGNSGFTSLTFKKTLPRRTIGRANVSSQVKTYFFRYCDSLFTRGLFYPGMKRGLRLSVIIIVPFLVGVSLSDFPGMSGRRDPYERDIFSSLHSVRYIYYLATALTVNVNTRLIRKA